MERSFPQKSIEILAPGGDFDSVKAAILAGADAVYCGLPVFNARQRAENIAPEDLRELIFIAHQRNRRIYLTLNTLLLEHEFNRLFDLLHSVTAMGIDAVIVQDLGLLFFLKTHFPGLEVHASTQTTTHNTGQIAFLSALNVAQVNLARELSLREIKTLVDFGKIAKIKSEVFVHGAYCISFSGQCYMSSAMTGHSGNRGACVQPCRRTYYLPEKKRNGLPFNLKDNSAFSSAGDLIQAGIDSFKIEGRIKNATYVFTTVIAWRKQVDRFLSSGLSSESDPSLGTVFNRQFSDGYLKGSIDGGMFIDTSRDQSLVLLSAITNYHADQKTVTLENDIAIPPETQTLIYTPDFRFVCTGFIEEKTARKRYRFRIEHELKSKINEGCVLYALGEQHSREDLKKNIDRLTVIKKPLTIHFRGSQGSALEATFVSGERSAVIPSNVPLAAARSSSLTESVIAQKMGMLGNSEFFLEKIDCPALEKNLFLPLKELNEMRRKGLSALTGEKPQPAVRIPFPESKKAVTRTIEPGLACLISSCRDIGSCGAETVTLLFEIPASIGNKMDSLVGIFKDFPNLIPWFGPILIDDDFSSAIDFLDRAAPPFIITDNSGVGMRAAAGKIPWIAGPLLNCVNSYALRCLQSFPWCKGAFISNELSKEQIKEISCPEPSGHQTFDLWFTLFNPLLLMNTRQCIIRTAGHCDKKTVDKNCLANCSRTAKITDSNNNPFFIEKRAGHYNQVFNGRHYCNPEIVRDLKNLFSTFVVDLRDITTQTSVRTSKHALLKSFLAHLHGEPGSGALLRKLIQTTTAGQYSRGL